MKEITRHIKELLFRHDCVILPSFGGFIGNYRPAGIDKANNRFTPPVKAISFNRNLTHNDGLLIGKLSEEKKIGYADAKVLVDEFVSHMRSRLEKGERVNLDLIGYFQLNDEGNIQFEPDSDSNFLLDSYGFGPFTRQAVSNYEISRRAGGRDYQPIRTSSTRKMAMRAAIAVPVIAAMILVPLKTDLFRNNASLNPLSSIELNEDSVSEISRAETTELGIPYTEPETPASPAGRRNPESPDNTIPAVAEIEQTGIRYHIVAGSFKNRENAHTLLNEAVTRGFSAELVDAGNGFVRVSLGSFTDRQDAIDRRFEISSDYPDSWVVKQ